MINEIKASQISKVVEELCIKANKNLPADIVKKIKDSAKCESCNLARSVLADLEKNIEVALEYDLPICQDTGMAVVFLEIGQDVHIIEGDLYEAVNCGVRNGYEKGLLRKSIVSDPLLRKNTDDNTPAVIHTEIVKSASNNPCPPMVVGVGIGGDFEQCALLSKKALCRSIDSKNKNTFYADLEKELLEKINLLNIGPQGFGGDTTAFGVNIETAPTHIAGLPVAVNIGCHVTRHATCEVK